MTPATAAPTGVIIDLPSGSSRRLLRGLVGLASALPWLLPAIWLIGGKLILDEAPPKWSWHNEALIALVGTSVTAAIVWSLFFPDGLSRMISRVWLARVVRRRADAVVDPEDPDALFVRLLPREAWTWPLCSDLHFGYLLAETETGLLLFEGDDCRWVLPAGSVISVGLEDFRVKDRGTGTGMRLTLVVVEARIEGHPEPRVAAVGPWSGGLHSAMADARSSRAAGLRDRIASLATTRLGDEDEPGA